MALGTPEQIKETFRSLDVNRDGRLCFAELKTLLLELQKRQATPASKSLQETEVRSIFYAVDANKDGFVSFDEFIDFIFSAEGAAQIRPACRFGDRCTRRDLRHWMAESHPGDPDRAASQVHLFPCVKEGTSPLPAHEGGYSWIRQGGSQEDRKDRCAAASATLEACRAAGYDFDLGRSGVRLRHLQRLVEGTQLMTLEDIKSELERVGRQRARGNPVVSRGSKNTALEEAMARAQSGGKVAVLSAASSYHPGGGFRSGGQHALEEAMCIQSTLCISIQRAIWLSAQRFAPAAPSNSTSSGKGGDWHPYIPEEAVILSPAVEVFRGSTETGYPFLSSATVLGAVISVGMPNNNPKVRDSPQDAPSDPEKYRRLLHAKLCAAVGAASLTGATCLVVPAVGCGVFGNDPRAVGAALGEAIRSVFCDGLEEIVLAGVPQEFFAAVQK